MTAFSEARLPARLAFGSTAGVERRTEITQLSSGFETRTTPWANGRRRYVLAASLRSLNDAAALTAFFEAQQGRLIGFRFSDFADFKSCLPLGAVSPNDQAIGTGDGATRVFQLTKTYGAGASAYVRTIAKPVAGSVALAVAGKALGVNQFSVDTTTGLVTLSAAPAAGAGVTAGFLFDTPVRFDTDRLDVTLENFTAGRVIAVPLVEVRV